MKTTTASFAPQAFIRYRSNLCSLYFANSGVEPNGKLSGNFVWLDMGLPNTEKESNTLNASVFTKFESLLSGYLHSFVLNSAQCSGTEFMLVKK